MAIFILVHDPGESIAGLGTVAAYSWFLALAAGPTAGEMLVPAFQVVETGQSISPARGVVFLGSLIGALLIEAIVLVASNKFG